MLNDVEHQILVAEERLRLAMLTSESGELDALISPDLIFTNHLGQVFGKRDDLELHQSGILKFHTLEPSETQVKASVQLAVVSVRMKVSGTYDGSPFAGNLRYTRLWCLSASGSWQIVAGHSSVIQQA